MRTTYTTIDGLTFNELTEATLHESNLPTDGHFIVSLILNTGRTHIVKVTLQKINDKFVSIESIRNLPNKVISRKKVPTNRIDSQPLPKEDDLTRIDYINDGFDAIITKSEYLDNSKEKVIELVKEFITSRDLTFLD